MDEKFQRDAQTKNVPAKNEPERLEGTAAIAGRSARSSDPSRANEANLLPAQPMPAGASVPIKTGPSGSAAAAAAAREEEAPRLLAEDQSSNMRYRWSQIQIGFVDEPRTAVQQADQLVADAIRQLAETFADERQRLEQQWDRGDNVSTEDLRLALQRYRAFFGRLLSI